MAKDPAFLFYPGDWMGGTMIMTRHQKGCYIDLLIAQFNNGPLSLESIRAILGQDQATWTVLSSKFKKDSAGNYSNERLATEIEKRKQYAESRKLNGAKGGRPKAYTKPYANHVGNLPEDKDENEIRGLVVFDGENEILKNRIQFEQVCMKTGKGESQAKEALRKYHLWLTERERYPMTLKAIFAGFEKWLMNEKNKPGEVEQQSNSAPLKYIND